MQLLGSRRGAFLAATALALIAGYVDAVAYLELHAYVANMTGAVVLMGMAGAELDLPGVGRQALTILGFFLGVVLSRLLRRLGWGPGPSYAAAGAVVLACAGPLGAGHLGVTILSVAMGLQNAALNVFGGVSLNTTFLTGNLQSLAANLADVPNPNLRRGFAIGLLPSVVLVYSAGAGLGALAVHHAAYPLLLPAIALFAAAAVALRFGR